MKAIFFDFRVAFLTPITTYPTKMYLESSGSQPSVSRLNLLSRQMMTCTLTYMPPMLSLGLNTALDR
jgi:hypothetical protein